MVNATKVKIDLGRVEYSRKWGGCTQKESLYNKVIYFVKNKRENIQHKSSLFQSIKYALKCFCERHLIKYETS